MTGSLAQHGNRWRGRRHTRTRACRERLAIAFTLVDNCLALGIDPESYLIDVIEKLERGFPLRRLSELIPSNWAAEKTAQKGTEQARAVARRRSRSWLASLRHRGAACRGSGPASYQAACKGLTFWVR